MEDAIDIEVRALLEKHRGEWKSIAAESSISYSWISQFVRNKIPNPGYVTLRNLRAHLLARAPAPAASEAA